MREQRELNEPQRISSLAGNLYQLAKESPHLLPYQLQPITNFDAGLVAKGVESRAQREGVFARLRLIPSGPGNTQKRIELVEIIADRVEEGAA